VDLGLAGRVAIVAASSRGLGRAAAEALAAEGARLVVSGRDEASLATARAELEASGAEVVALAGDVAARGTPERLVEAALESYGRLDVVVANAGGPRAGHALEVSDEELLAAFEANALSAIRLVRAALPHLRAQRFGRICCIASYSVVQPIPMLALSNTARTALWAYVKTAAHDLRGSGVTINLACPGVHATERIVELGLAGDQAGSPADFGQVVAFLCSVQASFVSGAAIVVDGGESLAL
jgi:3-oxoacyl-[acyl-carrier protein] reductase